MCIRDSPDIVAHKHHTVLFFENKDRFVLGDYEKTNFLRNTTIYSNSIAKLLANFQVHRIYYGIGIPSSRNNKQKDSENWSLVDFTIMIDAELQIEVVYDPRLIFR